MDDSAVPPERCLGVRSFDLACIWVRPFNSSLAICTTSDGVRRFIYTVFIGYRLPAVTGNARRRRARRSPR
ncbi:MAG: hypothetical protein P8183_06210 [Anaerolineae bacterium]